MFMSTNITRRQFVGTAAIAATSLPWGFLRSSVPQLPMEGYLPYFHGASAWLNSQPLSKENVRGKVVLVDFWTYSCINWRRSLPYVRAWARKYRDHGLVVVGVHAPEFKPGRLFQSFPGFGSLVLRCVMSEHKIPVFRRHVAGKASLVQRRVARFSVREISKSPAARRGIIL